MKKGLKLVAVLLVLACVITCFSACTGEKGEVTLVVMIGEESASYVVDTTGRDMKYLVDLLNYLKDNEEFTYVEAGGMVSSVNGYEAKSENHEFWAIYTDCVVGDIPYFDRTWGKVEYSGVTYGSALKGIVELPLTGGATYLFAISTW